MKPPLSTITHTTSLLVQRPELVACNVYVSAGRRQHSKELLNILRSSQKLCQQLRSNAANSNNSIAIVHAYADGPYDRSSFHIAGGANNVMIVASHLAKSAIDLLQSSISRQSDHDDHSRHPLVGIVDHVSVMPLTESTSRINIEKRDDIYIPSDAHGLAALCISHELSQRGVQCYTYGTADPNHTPLAQVRKQKTSFFKSGSLNENNTKQFLGICTVGSPSNFVENFNIRLTNNVTKQQAMSLTKKVRERDGGVIGVEALTLPYSNNRYETACNLLQPKLGSSSWILKKVDEWIEDQRLKNNLASNNAYEYYVDDAYRVGTTLEQCMDTLAKNNDSMDTHDAMVCENFENYLEVSCDD